MATDSGYSNQKKLGIAQFETIHSMGSSSHGKSVANKSLFLKDASAAIASVTEIFGQDGQVKYWAIGVGGYTALVGDVLRMDLASTLPNFEFEILELPDANTIYVLPIAPQSPIIGDTISTFGWITNKVSSDGSSSVAITSAPTQFNLDGNPQTVEQDTVVPANNQALPSLAFIYKDGIQVPVTKDTGLPSNTIPMPVEIVAASGTPINITAGDLNVQLSDQGVNADVVRIGDGTTQLGITAANEAKVHDADAKAELQGLKTVIGAVADLSEPDPAQSATVIQALKGINTNLLASLPTIDSGISALTALIEDVGLPAGTVSGIKTFTEDTLGNLQTFKSNLAGETLVAVSALPLPTGAATEAKQDALIAIDFATEAKQDVLIAKDFATQTTLAALLTELQLKADLSETQPVSIAAAIPSTINAGTITSAQIAVGLTAVRATVAGTAPNAARKKLMIKPSKNNTGAIYLGASGVTTGNGMEVIGPDRLEFEFDSGDYYLISDTAAQVCEIIEKV